MRARVGTHIYIVTSAAFLFVASCAREVVWPPASGEDLKGKIYLAALTGGGAEVVAVGTGGVQKFGVPCDDDGEVALSPDGLRLYYGRDDALRERELATGAERVVASFPGGVAREGGTDEDGKAKVFAWRCGCRFRDLSFAPDGRVAFVVEPTECPLADEEAAEAGGELTPRTAFALDAGAYVAETGREPHYLGVSRAVYGFLGDDALLLENKLTVARYEFDGGAATPLLPPEAHELGWLPPAALAGERVVVVAPRAVEKSEREVLNRVFVIDGGRGRDEPLLEIRARAPATRAALSPDGRYLAVEFTPQVFGEPAVYVVDLDKKGYKVLATAGRLAAFGRGGRAVFYVAGRGRGGDVVLAGLDGQERRLTSKAQIMPPP
jgi:hypothetical protein